MSVKPLGARVLIRAKENEEKTATGIYIPDNAKDTPQEGVVEACGTDASLENGTKVIYGKFAGTEIEHDGEKFIIMNEEDILAKIEE